MSAKLKVIFLFIFTILVASCSTGTKVVNSDKIKPGMTKIDVEFVLSFRAMNYQAGIPLGYREYFSNLKMNYKKRRSRRELNPDCRIQSPEC